MANALAAFNLCEPDLDRFLTSGAEAGFKNVALYVSPGRLPFELETLTTDQAGALRRQLAGHGLTAVAAGGGNSVTTADGLALFLRKLEGAARLGVAVFDTGTVSTRDKDTDLLERETAAFCAAMGEAGETAARLGLTICLETHGGLTGTVPAALHLIRRIGHPRIRIGYDPANIRYYEGASPLDGLPDLVPFIGHVHAKDQVGGQGSSVFPTVGKGEVPYPEIVATLVKYGYAGCISVERAPGETPAARARELKDAFAFLSGLLDG
ncbi:MAG: sugar phosphate isomerase/epimerase [Kiritimatiellae bacterium]|nr:sugar phosphate isomerase/epimerase [Kiritimatiellia bacterium]